MKAIVYQKYGSPDVLEMKDVEKPSPKAKEVLIKTLATTVTPGDTRVRSSQFGSALFWLAGRLFFGLFKPRKNILGTELAGKIEAVGKDVKRFKEGDSVFVSAGAGFGAHGEYVCKPEESAITVIPKNISYEQAAAVPFGALAALYFLRDQGKVQMGEKVLINGASGGIGTFAVQLAKHFGAEVTGVCSTANLGLVKSLGADHVVDYTQEDFTKNGQTYDVIFDTVGKISFSRSKDSLVYNGRYLAAVMGLPEVFQTIWTSFVGKKKVIGGVATEKVEDLHYIKELIEAEVVKPVIDRRYPFEKTAEAHKYVDKGHKIGSVVITVS